MTTANNYRIELSITTGGTKDAPTFIIEDGMTMTPEEFTSWVWQACQAPKAPAIYPSRDPVSTWYDTKEKPASKESLAKLDQWREAWNAVLKKNPEANKETLLRLTHEWLADAENRRKLKEVEDKRLAESITKGIESWLGI